MKGELTKEEVVEVVAEFQEFQEFQESNPEPVNLATKTTRLTYKQTHELVVYCSQVPEQVHETWVAMAEAATEKLGFKVTVYSLKMALEAAGRNTDSVLKLVVELPVTEAMYWSSVKSVEAFGNSLVAMTNYIESLEARVEALERKVKELQEKVDPPMDARDGTE